jgi:hypothetical protein
MAKILTIFRFSQLMLSIFAQIFIINFDQFDQFQNAIKSIQKVLLHDQCLFFFILKTKTFDPPNFGRFPDFL